MQQFTTTPKSCEPGLDLFAAAWLERWTALGGSMMVHPDGSGQTGIHVNVTDVPGYKPPPEHWSKASRQHRMDVDEWMFTGRTRELLELLEMVPGGKDAVKAHVRAYPSFAAAGGIVGVM